MANLPLTDTLRRDYQRLFDNCAIRPERAAGVEQAVARILLEEPRYRQVTALLGVPWQVVAAIHQMESGGRFDRHLHNGDPLGARTVQVPAGRPKKGAPPFSWETSASDALELQDLDGDVDWSLAGTLYQLERYNGWGYRRFHPHVPSPYLWSYSSLYTSGKYVADGTWSETAVSKQCGAAVLLRRLAERGAMAFPDRPAPADGDPPLVSTHAAQRPGDPAAAAKAEALQRWLNTFPGIFLKVDGAPGDRTSEAYRKVTGSFLPGDPRA